MNEIQKYFRYRQGLIDQYVKGDMNKREYLYKNLEAVQSLHINPFKNVDTVEKGLFNYQYYNALAKDAKVSASIQRDKEAANEYLEQSNYYYSKKDQATNNILKILDYRDISAYFIKVKSKFLKGKLVEIIINDYDMILHSTNPKIINNLKNELIFSEEIRQSIIDGYINQKY